MKPSVTWTISLRGGHFDGQVFQNTPNIKVAKKLKVPGRRLYEHYDIIKVNWDTHEAIAQYRRSTVT